MQVLDQAHAGGHHLGAHSYGAGDVLVAGLLVVTGVGVVAFMGDIADQGDAAAADQLGAAAAGQEGTQVVFSAVVLDHRAVAVGGAVQGRRLAIGGHGIAEQAAEHHGVGRLPGGAEHQDLLPLGGWVPDPVLTRAQRQPGQPAGEQSAALDAHTGGGEIHLGDGAEADQVFDKAGEGGEGGHATDGAGVAREVQPGGVVMLVFTMVWQMASISES